MIVLCVALHRADPDIRRCIDLAAASARSIAERLTDIAPGTIPGGVIVFGNQALLWLRCDDLGLITAATNTGLTGIAFEPTPMAFTVWRFANKVLPTRYPAPVPVPVQVA